MGLAARLRSFFVASDENKDGTEATSAATPSSYSNAADRIKSTRRFEIEDIELLGRTHQRFDSAPGTPWDDFRGSFLVMPKWFRFDLNPMTEEYARQQHQLWGVLAGVNRGYDPLIDEATPLGVVDAIRFPGHFQRRDPQAIDQAAEHILATGMLMKH